MQSVNTMSPPINIGSSMGGSGMAEQMKSALMTMLMFKSINGGATASTDLVYMVYVFIITQLVELIMKYIPDMVMFVKRKYTDVVQVPLLAHLDTPTSVAEKTKSASISIRVGVSDHENMIGLALLDYITNHENTSHIAYVKQTYTLNERAPICIADDIFAIMKEDFVSDDHVPDAKAQSQSEKDVKIQSFEIYSFTKRAKELRSFLSNIRHEFVINAQNKLGPKKFYFNMKPVQAPLTQGSTPGTTLRDYSRLPPYFTFTMKEFQTNRKFSNLFGDEIAIIRKRVQFFIKHRKWYDEKGVPYTLGLLLSGDPGTGKTSCIKCLANETDRHIVNINLNNDITKTQLENLFFNESITILNPATNQMEKFTIPLDKRIYVLEDIDCQGSAVLDRGNPLPNITGGGTQSAEMDKMDMSFLLNLLDGVLETPGRILIMTSNYPETIDKALIRPGRIDIIAKFQKCRHNTIIEMMEFFYNIELTQEQKASIYKLPDQQMTPAELSKLMYEHFGEPNDAIQYLSGVDKGLEKKHCI